MNEPNFGTGIVVKKFNVFEIYSFVKEIQPLAHLPKEDVPLKNVLFTLFSGRVALSKFIKADSILLPPSKRAAGNLIGKINDIVPDSFDAFKADPEQKIDGYKFYYIKQALENFEAVLSADMPGISSYVVAQKGIYNTDDLIDGASKQLNQTTLSNLPYQALRDINEAGRCLAFELPTASAFHLWRAVETVMCVYYKELTGKSFEDDEVSPNWGAYIKALIAEGAAEKVTQFLDHIRAEYRNPISHPEENVELAEALDLFSAGCSSISQMSKEIASLKEEKQAAGNA